MQVVSIWKKSFRILALIFAILIVVASAFTQPPAASPGRPFLEPALVPPAVRVTLLRSCRDCHSDSPRYPWYSRVAPVSWLVSRDVMEGREHLNFSHWGEYSLVRRERSLSEIANQVQDREMPLPLYTFMHPDARLSKYDIAAIFQWTQEERARLIAESARSSGR